tara:strand:+ start:84 stop:602 length:519 start_codon:yes stop_codon:yes gene_type:complete
MSITLIPNSLISTEGTIRREDGETALEDGLEILSDGNSSTGVQFVSNNSSMIFGVSDTDSLPTGTLTVNAKFNYGPGTKTNFTLRVRLGEEAEFTALGAYEGGPSNDITISIPVSVHQNSVDKVNLFEFVLSSSTGEQVISEFKVEITGTGDPRLVKLTSGKIKLSSGKITL